MQRAVELAVENVQEGGEPLKMWKERQQNG